MYLHQRQPGPQPPLYSLSFSFTWGLLLVSAAVGQVLQQKLVRGGLSASAGSWRKSWSLSIRAWRNQNRALAPSPSAFSFNNSRHQFSTYITTMSPHFAGSSTPHISCMSVPVFLLTFAFTLFLVWDHIAEAGWKIFFFFIIFYFLNQAWMEEKLYNNQGFSCILILGAATTAQNVERRPKITRYSMIIQTSSWVSFEMQWPQHGLKQKKKINFPTKKYFFQSKTVQVSGVLILEHTKQPDTKQPFAQVSFLVPVVLQIWLVVCEEHSDADGWNGAEMQSLPGN